MRSRRPKGGSRVPRAADYTSDDELPMLGGDIGNNGLPFNMTDDEAEQYMAELRAREQRRRPVGFAAWPEEKPRRGRTR